MTITEEKKDELTAIYAPKEEQTSSNTPSASTNKQNYLERKAEQARIRKLKNDILKVEEKIKANEERLNELDELLADPEIAKNSAKLNEISKEQDKISETLDELMAQWKNYPIYLTNKRFIYCIFPYYKLKYL